MSSCTALVPYVPLDAKPQYTPPLDCPLSLRTAGISFGVCVLVALLTFGVASWNGSGLTLTQLWQTNAGQSFLQQSLLALLVNIALLLYSGTLLRESWQCRCDFCHQLSQANRHRLFDDEATLIASAQKHFIEIIRNEQAITEAWQEHHQHPRFIAYCYQNWYAGGEQILNYYDEPMKLLREAKRYDATHSWEDYRLGRTAQELAVAGKQVIGTAEIDQMLKAIKQPIETETPPWESMM